MACLGFLYLVLPLIELFKFLVCFYSTNFEDNLNSNFDFSSLKTKALTSVHSGNKPQNVIKRIEAAGSHNIRKNAEINEIEFVHFVAVYVVYGRGCNALVF